MLTKENEILDTTKSFSIFNPPPFLLNLEHNKFLDITSDRTPSHSN